MQARKVVVSGEAAGLQIQLGPPAVPGRFDSCDFPPTLLLCIKNIPITNLKSKFQLNLKNPPSIVKEKSIQYIILMKYLKKLAIYLIQNIAILLLNHFYFVNYSSLIK
ncbi:hypothetical protein SS31_20300 [Pluralibacter gergoviae]|nr:hypothetical protein SS31_20300 [Pluralibacter gergoviae]